MLQSPWSHRHHSYFLRKNITMKNYLISLFLWIIASGLIDYALFDLHLSFLKKTALMVGLAIVVLAVLMSM